MFTKYMLEVKKGNNSLLINTLTGAIDVVDNSSIDKVRQGEKSELYYKLKRRGYFKNDEEKKIINLLNKYNGKVSTFTNTINLMLCLTYSCNLRCTYCFEKHEIHNKEGIMSLKQIEKAISDVEHIILKKFNKRQFVISLFGGEPLQEKTYYLVKRVLQMASYKGVFVNIITNGVELARFVDLFYEYRNIISIQITLDGIKDIHNKNRPGYGFEDSYSIIARNISVALDMELPIIVRINTSLETSKYLNDFFKSKDFTEWCSYPNFKAEIAPVTNHFAENIKMKIYQESNVLDSIVENTEIFEYLGKKVFFTADMFRITGYLRCQLDPRFQYNISPTIKFCEATQLTTYAVGPDNYVYLCTDTIGKKEYAAGKYYPQLILKEEYISKLKNRNVFTMEKCRDCEIATFCGGGCPAAALKKYNDIEHGFCGNAKELVEEFLGTVRVES